MELALPRRRRVARPAALYAVPAAVAAACVLAVALPAAPRSLAAVPAPQAAPPAPRAARDSAAYVDPALATTGSRVQAVVVQAGPGRAAAVAAAVAAAGGTVGRMLPIVDGFAARLTPAQLRDLARHPDVRAFTADTSVRFQQVKYDAAGVASVYPKVSGALAAWRNNRLGAGIGVAVVDTGISAVNDVAGRVVHGPDLSGEGRTVDSFGHGTVMAGAIAGSGADSDGSLGGAHAGVAPRATLVSVKVAGRNGATDVSTVLQALHWVSAYQRQFNIRVLNVSWGTSSQADPASDPLNYAVERLWRQGVVVVVSAGNSGPGAGTVLKPADDPLVLTVGAYDDHGTVDPADDTVPEWSSRGPTAYGVAKPDLLAPGRTLVTTRSFGSAVEQANPQALVGPSYIKGSGTSQAAAVVSGLAALLLEARPELTPDQVKALLTRTAEPLPGVPAGVQGAGRVKLDGALNAAPGPAEWQTFRGTGLGSLEASRGGAHVVHDCHEDGEYDVIEGEQLWTCEPWNGASWTGGEWTGASWTGASWTGASWTGASWTGASWTGASWTGGEWTGASWTGASWTGASWTGASWTGASWTGASWTGASWTGASWTGASWTSAAYGAPVEPDGFAVAFWGLQPRFWQQLPGEVSEALPTGCAWTTYVDEAGATPYVHCVDPASYGAVSDMTGPT